MAVSHFTDKKFGISLFTRKKTFLYDQFFSLWLRTIAKELPCSMSSPCVRFLFLVLCEGNRVLCLEVEARYHLLLIQNHCHQRSRHRIQRAGLLQKFQMKIRLFFHHLVALHCHSSRWIQHPILVSQIITAHGEYQNHVSRGTERWLQNSRGIKTAIHGSRKYRLPASM